MNQKECIKEKPIWYTRDEDNIMKQSKKLIIMNILKILKEHSDVEHPLTQKEIQNILEFEYDMKVDRKAIKRNLMNLIDFGYDINYTEKTRQKKNGDHEIVFTDWYLEREFEDSELRYIIDGLLFSKHIPTSQCKQLIDKISRLSSNEDKIKIKHMNNLPENTIQNKELFYTIEVLDEAIDKQRQVRFTYNIYGIDKKMHPKREEKYIVNPYQMAATNGRYYLICNYDKYDNISHYRIDRITDIEILPTSCKPKEEVKDIKYGLDLPKHMAEHIYMFAGKSVRVVFEAKAYLVTEILDWFGKETEFERIDEDTLKVSVYVNLSAMKYWALQYARHVKVLSPKELVETIKEEIETGAKNYE